MNAIWTAAGIGLLGFSTRGKEIHFSPPLCPHFSSVLIWSHYFVRHLPGSKSNNLPPSAFCRIQQIPAREYRVWIWALLAPGTDKPEFKPGSVQVRRPPLSKPAETLWVAEISLANTLLPCPKKATEPWFPLKYWSILLFSYAAAAFRRAGGLSTD